MAIFTLFNKPLVSSHEIMGMDKKQFKDLTKESRKELIRPIFKLLAANFQHDLFHRRIAPTKSGRIHLREFGTKMFAVGTSIATIGATFSQPWLVGVGSIHMALGTQKLAASIFRTEKRNARKHQKITSRISRLEKQLLDQARRRDYIDLKLAHSLPKLVKKLNSNASQKHKIRAVNRFLAGVDQTLRQYKRKAVFQLDSSLEALSRLQEVQVELLKQVRQANGDQKIIALLADSFSKTSQEVNALFNIKSGVTTSSQENLTAEFLAKIGFGETPFGFEGVRGSVVVEVNGDEVRIKRTFERELETDALEVHENDSLERSGDQSPSINSPRTSQQDSGRPSATNAPNVNNSEIERTSPQTPTDLRR